MHLPRLGALLALTLIATIGARPETGLASTHTDRLSLDIRGLDIYDAVRALATQAGENVVVDASVPHHEVTLRLHDVPFAEALATLARTNDLESVRIDGITYVGTSEVMNRRYPAEAGGVATRVFTLRFASPQDVAHGLAGVLPLGTVVVPDTRTASVVVTGSPSVLARAHALAVALDAPTGDRTVSRPMRFARATDVVRALQATIAIPPPASVYASDEQNAVVLGGPPEFLARAGDFIDRLDRRGREVRYDVEVTDVVPQNDSGDVGFLYGGSFGGGTGGAGTFSVGSAPLTFPIKTVAIDATIDALVTQSRARVLARPNISTLNDTPASLLVGEQYPIVYFDARTGTQQVQFVNIGVNLNVTPTIGSDGDIVTELETDYSQIIGTAAGGFPRIGTRKAQSRIRVHDGESIVIAGLFSDLDSTTITKIPLLGDIPVLGEFFKNRQYARSKDEVVFMLTPHLVGAVDDASPTETKR